MLDIQLGPFDMTALEPTFDNLPEDIHTEGAFRFRRLSSVTVKWNGDECSFSNAPGSILQSPDDNGYLGGVNRHYDAIEDSTFAHPRFVEMMKKFQTLTGWKDDFQVHQIRIKALPGKFTLPAPEGPHQDGYTWTVPFVLGTTNATGGEARVYDSHMNKLLKGALSHNYLVFDDGDVYHYADPIALIDESKPGHWDTFVFTAGQK